MGYLLLLHIGAPVTLSHFTHDRLNSPEVPIVVNKEPGLVELVLVALVPVSHVRRLGNVDAVQVHPRPRHVHLAPGYVAVRRQGATLYAPRAVDVMFYYRWFKIY